MRLVAVLSLALAAPALLMADEIVLKDWVQGVGSNPR